MDNELLKYAVDNGMINLSYVQEQIEMNKRTELLKKHPYKIWEGKDGKWRTYLPDEEKGRILKKRSTENAIKDMIVEYYLQEAKNESKCEKEKKRNIVAVNIRVQPGKELLSLCSPGFKSVHRIVILVVKKVAPTTGVSSSNILG